MDSYTRIQKADLQLAERILKEWSQQRQPLIKGLCNESQYRRVANEFSQLINTSSSEALFATNAQSCALAGIGLSDWDSGILGVQVAKLRLFTDSLLTHRDDWVRIRDVLDKLLDSLEEYAQNTEVDVMFTRVDVRDIHLCQALESRGFRMMDAIVTLYHEFGSSLDRGDFLGKPTMTVRPCTCDDVPAIELIARAAFNQGHFHNDPRIPHERACEVYAQWAVNSCRGRAAAVLVAERPKEPGIPCGFITCGIDSTSADKMGKPQGVIGLVAVEPESQGRGTGRALVTAALDWFDSEGTHGVEVGTQLGNMAAIRTYQSLGFRCVSFAHTLHKWFLT